MKNVTGLLDAMKVVESACEKDEITIIGEGAMPSPTEMLAKCAKFIEAQYGKPVKMLAVIGNEAVSYDTECSCDCSCDCEECSTCDDDDNVIDEEEVEVAKFDTDGIREYLAEDLGDMLDCLDEDVVEEIAEEIVGYYANHLDGSLSEDLNSDVIISEIAEIIADKVIGLKWSLAEEVATDVEDYIADHFYEAVKE